jgi:hypothetical protein
MQTRERIGQCMCGRGSVITDRVGDGRWVPYHYRCTNPQCTHHDPGLAPPVTAGPGA